MSDRPESHPRSSRQRYREFVRDYKLRRLDEPAEADTDKERVDASPDAVAEPDSRAKHSRKRREYLREYLRWLWPHRYAVGAVFVLALLVAGLEMIEPLFMRFIIDRVLLNTDAGHRPRA